MLLLYIYTAAPD